jgi:hypothetical protein
VLPLQVVSAVIAGSQARQPVSNPNRWIQLSFVFVIVFGCVVYFREEIWALGKGKYIQFQFKDEPALADNSMLTG